MLLRFGPLGSIGQTVQQGSISISISTAVPEALGVAVLRCPTALPLASLLPIRATQSCFRNKYPGRSHCKLQSVVRAWLGLPLPSLPPPLPSGCSLSLWACDKPLFGPLVLAPSVGSIRFVLFRSPGSDRALPS